MITGQKKDLRRCTFKPTTHQKQNGENQNQPKKYFPEESDRSTIKSRWSKPLGAHSPSGFFFVMFVGHDTPD